jgi:hypothetical protein
LRVEQELLQGNLTGGVACDREWNVKSCERENCKFELPEGVVWNALRSPVLRRLSMCSEGSETMEDFASSD